LDFSNLPAPAGSDFPYNNMQPVLGLQYIIALQGIYPGASGDLLGTEPTLGQIALFAGNIAPQGWEFCDGQLLSINSNEALYSLLGTDFGGNGTTNFDLPNLEGRAGVGEDNGVGLDGLTSFSPGEETGTETLQLSPSQVPAANLPEPCSFGVAAMGAMCLSARRRGRTKA
jgi:microcystin-dependent protein